MSGIDPAPDIFSNDEFDRRAIVEEILTGPYPHAKEAILMLEIFSGKRSQRAVYELRDTLDHLSIALNSTTSPAEARRHLAECNTHLRRAAVEPYEWLAERKFLEIEKILVRGKWLYWCLFLDIPIGAEMLGELRAIGLLIKEGRVAKGCGNALDFMREANIAASSLLDKLKPQEIKNRYFDILLGCVFLILGAILGVVATELYNNWYHSKP